MAYFEASLKGTFKVDRVIMSKESLKLLFK